MNVTLFVNDTLWHRYKRAFPHADLGAFLRAAMSDQVRDKEKSEETARWERLGVPAGDRL